MPFDPKKLEEFRKDTPGFDPSKLERTRAGEPQYGLTERPRSTQLSSIGKFAKQAALPTIGSAGGMMLGAPGGPAGMLIGESAGGALGELTNQILGITEPSKTAIGLSAAAPGVARGAFALAREGLRRGAKYLPGAGVAAQEQAVQAARQLPGKITVERPAEEIFDEIASTGTNPLVPVSGLERAIAKLEAEEAKVSAASLKNKSITSMIEDFREVIRANQGGIPFEELRANLKRINAKVRDTRQADNELHGAYKLVRGGIQEDLGRAAQAGTPEAKLLGEANRAYRKESASEELGELVESAITTRSDGFVSLNPGRLLDKIRKDEYLQKSMDPSELAAIRDALHQMTQLPKLPAQAGAQFGSGRVVGRGAVGYAAMGELGAAAAAYGPQLIARALMTDRGRTTITRLMSEGGGMLDAKKMAMLGQALASGTIDRSAQPSQPTPQYAPEDVERLKRELALRQQRTAGPLALQP